MPSCDGKGVVMRAEILRPAPRRVADTTATKLATRPSKGRELDRYTGPAAASSADPFVAAGSPTYRSWSVRSGPAGGPASGPFSPWSRRVPRGAALFVGRRCLQGHPGITLAGVMRVP